MAHDITFEIPPTPLGKLDATYVIKRNGEKLGKLHISLGGIDWFPKHARTPLKLDWNQFALIVEKDKWDRTPKKKATKK